MRLQLPMMTMAGMVLALSAQAHDARIGAIHVMHPAAPATLPGQSSGAVYLSIANEGTAADRLVSLTSPAASGVAIHTMSMDGTTMKMREIDSLPLAPAVRVEMKANTGYHLMMTNLKQPLKAGDQIPLTLTFERAGKLEVSVHVGPSAAQQVQVKAPAP